MDHPQTLRPLQLRNFQLFLAGRTASESGTWLQFVALAWLTDGLTGSGAALGWVAVATFGPLLVLGPWTGALADRVDKHRLLIATQVLIAGQAAALGAVALTGVASVVVLYGLTLVHGLLYAVETPARRAFVAELVGEDQILQAVSLNSGITAAGRVLGPVCAGALIASAGTGWCFLATASSYLVALAGLLLMRRDRLRVTAPTREPSAARAGLRYAWSIPELRIALLLTGIVATFGFNHQVLVPLLATQTFDGDVGAYTVLYTAISVGSVVGALAVARRRDIDLRFLGCGILAFAATNALVAVAPNLLLAAVAGFSSGATALLFVTASTALLQNRCAPVMRGRVMALSAMVLLGGLPIGAPLVGWVADVAGPRTGVAVGSLAALLAGVVALRHVALHDRKPTPMKNPSQSAHACLTAPPEG
jgi:MFS family permease